MEEAEALRAGGRNESVLLLEGAVDRDELERALQLDLDLVFHTLDQVDDLAVLAGRGLDHRALMRTWLKLDTGMNRLGFSALELRHAWSRLMQLLAPATPGMMSHLANADADICGQPGTLTATQLLRFNQAVASVHARTTSLCNSAGLLRELRCDSWMRPGIMLYGISPLADTCAQDLELRPVMTFESRVIAVREVGAGDGVGYASTWRAPVRSRIAVIAAGYGDGYPRYAPNGTPVLVNGHKAALVGRVSMDMLTVDVTSLPKVARGDKVVLWGQGLPAEQVAQHAGTIAYALLCGVTNRVRREWHD